MNLLRALSFGHLLTRNSRDTIGTSSFDNASVMESGTELQETNMTEVVRDQESGATPSPGASEGTAASQPSVHSDPADSSKAPQRRMPRSSLGGLPLDLVAKRKRASKMQKERQREHDSKVVLDKLDLHQEGYPQVASFVNSDANFVIYRKFGYLHHRVLLYRQDELCELQDNLEWLDKDDAKEDAIRLKSREQDEINSSKRKDMVDRIENKLKDYDDLLFRVEKMRSLKTPSERNHRSVWNWLDNKDALISTEKTYIFHKDDLVLLSSGKENSPADELVEKVFHLLGWKWLEKRFSKPEQQQFSNNPDDHFYDRDSIHRITKTLGRLALLACVAIPVTFLFEVDASNVTKLCIVLGCTLVFPSVIETFTPVDRQQVFATTVAYCAVLVVFLGNLQNVNCKTSKSSQGT